MSEGEKGIDYCPNCEEDLITNIGNTYRCNSCELTWELKETAQKD